MFWPMILIFFAGSTIPSAYFQEDRDDGYATVDECIESLPSLLEQVKRVPLPFPGGIKVTYASGCPTIQPFDLYIQLRTPNPRKDI